MGIERNSTDGAGAVDDEKRRLLSDDDLHRLLPLLRYSPKALQEIHKALDAGSQPSEAINSGGNVNDSDLNRDLGPEGFFSNMEKFRQQNMVSPDTLPPTSDPEDDRFFGDAGRTPEPNPTSAPVNFPGQIRHMPAAGRFGRRRTR